MNHLLVAWICLNFLHMLNYMSWLLLEHHVLATGHQECCWELRKPSTTLLQIYELRRFSQIKSSDSQVFGQKKFLTHICMN